MDPPPPDPTDPMDEPMDLDSMDQSEPTLNGVSNGYDHDHAAATEESSPPPAAHSPHDESSAPLDLSEEALLASDPELEDLDADRADVLARSLENLSVAGSQPPDPSPIPSNPSPSLRHRSPRRGEPYRAPPAPRNARRRRRRRPQNHPRRPSPARTPSPPPLPRFSVNFMHYLCSYHPWAKSVNPRPREMFTYGFQGVTNELPVSIYKHIPDAGYMSTRFTRSLFPNFVIPEQAHRRPVPFIELQHLEDTVGFRYRSESTISDLYYEVYRDEDVSGLAQNINGDEQYTIDPPTRRGYRPVLYQVVSTGWGTGVILEAKDFFTVFPDRRDLHCIVLDQYAVNHLTGLRGFRKSHISVKDYVWVYDVKPTRQALERPGDTLTASRVPRTTALDSNSVFFFRVSHFALITPVDLPDPVYGIIISRKITRTGKVASLKAVFEGAPEAVTITTSICDFPLDQVREDEIVMALTRANGSCAMRFSEPAASQTDLSILCDKVRHVLPLHPEEGLVPLHVWKLDDSERAWLDDRAGEFENFRLHNEESKLRMSKLFNMACSALAAINSADDDRQSHRVSASVPIPPHFPTQLSFVLNEMNSEAGWCSQRPVALHILGSDTIVRAKVATVEVLTEQHALHVTLEAFIWSNSALTDLVHRYGRLSGPLAFVDLVVRLGRQTNRANPVYDAISRMNIYEGLRPHTLAHTIVNQVYGFVDVDPAPARPHSPVPPANPLADPIAVPPSFTINGAEVQLTADQAEAVRLAVSPAPIVAIQAAFGTGKTMVGAFIAALIASQPQNAVIVTATTNAAVAQFTETLLSLEQFPDLNIVRYLSDTAASENLYPTSVDLNNIFKTMIDDYLTELSDDERRFCADFKANRQILERYLANPNRRVNMPEEDQHEYEIAERSVSNSVARMVRIMFRVCPPAIICMTTASLLNTADTTNGIFRNHIGEYGTIIGDEASQIPEPALAAICSRLPNARHRYIGDVHQLEPHARCPRTANPARYGARGIMTVLVNAAAVPVAPLVTTFRAHPELNALPNVVAYDGTLVSGADPATRQLLLSVTQLPNPKVPFLFVDVKGPSTKALSKSHYNTNEQSVCLQLVKLLLAKGLTPPQLCVISFYKEQSLHLQHKLDALRVELTTVDSVQGREKQVVILLTTRTNFAPDSADFLDDYRRMNVAISRCRHGQFILGEVSSLTVVPFWKRVVDWATSINAVAPADHLERYFRE